MKQVQQPSGSKNRGFIALISVILIAGFLSLMLLSYSMKVAALREGITIMDEKQRSIYAAESCAELAKLKFAQNPEYVQQDYFLIQDISCHINNSVAEASTTRVYSKIFIKY